MIRWVMIRKDKRRTRTYCRTMLVKEVTREKLL
jgi:hypothetical protein